MSSTRYYIIRHGLATHSTTGYGDQILTAQILPESIPIIEKIGQYLRNIRSDYNVRSEIFRCQQTAEIITRLGQKPFITDARLNEYNQESFEQLHDRVKSFLDEVESKNFHNVLICTHGSVISGLENFLLNGEFLLGQEFTYPLPGQVSIIQNKQKELIDFN